MQILQIFFFQVGYEILRQIIITPVKGAYGTLIQNTVSTSYYSTASNSKTSRESSRTNAWLRLNVWSCRSAKKITLADNHGLHEAMSEMIYQRQLQTSANRYNLSSTEPSKVKELEKKTEVETRESDPENDEEDLEYDSRTDEDEELARGDPRS